MSSTSRDTTSSDAPRSGVGWRLDNHPPGRRSPLDPLTDRARHPQAWRILQEAGRPRHLATGGELPALDERSAAIVLIAEGALKLVGLAENGTTATLAVRPAGSIVSQFGWDRTSRRSMVAVLPSVVVTVPGKQVTTAVREHPWLAVLLMETMGSLAVEADHRLLAYIAYDASERIRQVLLRLTRLFQSACGRPVIPLAQQDLADLAGVSREATAKELRRLRESGAVRTGRSRIAVVRTDLIGDEA
ncbi:Crp/Fnr family transcriptional regulator [Micromonospora sp. NBC_01638]|uniref:Crp/Fnr family transcriptional regulator n=1 Tax=Micromonospora sp. NBC_01638 TaxID=2975982 RepID=UPI00386EDA06|nr:Crp/Fnr family transcriptional regulator [Micromonospora sp. NBC_01638]